MNNLSKITVVLIIVSLVGLIFPKNVNSHAGHGPPAIKVNGQLVQTPNPYNFTTTKIPIAGEFAPENYLVDKEISFEIDKSLLVYTPEVISQAEFRWNLGEEKNKYLSGYSHKYTYTKTGSYVITVEVSTDKTNYSLFASFQVNIVPEVGYKLPIAKIATVGKNYKTGKPITFQAQPETDPSTSVKSYFWELELGTDKTSDKPAVSRVFEQQGELGLFDAVFLRITDKNGLFADTYVEARIVDESLTISLPYGAEGQVPVIAESNEKYKTLPFIVGFFVLVAIITGFGFYRFNKKKTKVKKKK